MRMKELNCKAKNVFCKMLFRLEDGYLKLDNGSGFMPVTGSKAKSAGYVIYGTVLSFVAYSKTIELNSDRKQVDMYA